MIVVIILYILYSFGTDILTKFLDESNLITDTASKYLWGLFTIVEFSCFSLFFYFNLENSWLQRVIIIIIVVFTSFCLISLLSNFIIYGNLDTVPVTFQAIFVMTLCVIYFFEQIRNPNSLFIYSTAQFWIVTGILVYLAGTFFIYIYSWNLTQEELDKYWTINYFFNAVKNFLFGLGLYIHVKNQRKKSQKTEFNYYSLLENP